AVAAGRLARPGRTVGLNLTGGAAAVGQDVVAVVAGLVAFLDAVVAHRLVTARDRRLGGGAHAGEAGLHAAIGAAVGGDVVSVLALFGARHDAVTALGGAAARPDDGALVAGLE